MMRPVFFSFAALVIAFCGLARGASSSSLRSAGDVIIVDDQPGPGVDHTSLPKAIAAAAAGDIVLVRTGLYIGGTYPPTVIDKTLAIVADGNVFATGEFEARNLAGKDFVAMRGFNASSDLRLNATDCAGTVWLEESAHANGFTLLLDLFPRYTGADRVVLQRSSFKAANLSSIESAVHAYDCTFTAPSGGTPSPVGIPYLNSDGFLFASGSRFESGYPGLFPDLTVNGTAQVFLRDTVADDVPAGVVTLPGVARSYAAAAIVREGESLPLYFDGVQGDQVFVLVSDEPAAAFLPDLSGTLVVGNLVAPPVFVGTIPITGRLAASVTMPSLPAGVEGKVFFSQAVFVNHANETHLAGGSMVVLLNSSI